MEAGYIVLKNQIKVSEKPELFILDEKAVSALHIDEIKETFKAMEEAGVSNPPVNHLILAYDPKIYKSSFLKGYVDEHIVEKVDKALSMAPNEYVALEVCFISNPNIAYDSNSFVPLDYWSFRHAWINRKTYKFKVQLKEVPQEHQEVFKLFVKTLLVLLVTKNAEKDRVENKPNSSSAKARNASKHFGYTTTIRIGKITENCKSGGTGSPMRPHLRRGHVRNQPYGEGRREIKQIFIAPVFINADKEYVESQRIAYKIRA